MSYWSPVRDGVHCKADALRPCAAQILFTKSNTYRTIRALNIMLVGKRNSKTAQDRRIPSLGQTRISLSPAWTLRLIICGALLAAISTLLPWGVEQLYLPWSLIIGGGTRLQGSEFLTVSVLIRAATIVGWAGVILYEYIERRILPYVTILTSSILSFTAVAFFATTEIGLSWGAFLGLVGGVLMVLGVVIEKLEVEVVVQQEEKNEEEREDDLANGPQTSAP